mgnify:CR=1 FL=1
MPIDKLGENEKPLSIDIEAAGMPEIEIVLEEDGGATIEMGEDEATEVDFYDNLAEVIDPTDLTEMSKTLLALFEADKSSRSDWETMYSKGLDLLGLKLEERTKPFRGAAGAVHPMLTEAIGPLRNWLVSKSSSRPGAAGAPS